MCKDGHWLWQGSLSDGRYGQFWANGKHIKAHRFAWEFFIGPLNQLDELHHACGNKLCVKPWHLEKTDHETNMFFERKDKCKNGHEIAKVGRTASGNCNQCSKDYKRDWYQRNKGK